MDWANTTARGYKKHLCFGIWWDLYYSFYGRLYISCRVKMFCNARPVYSWWMWNINTGLLGHPRMAWSYLWIFYALHQVTVLTHWGWVTHICISKLTIISSDNGLWPDLRQTIIWTNDAMLLIRSSDNDVPASGKQVRCIPWVQMGTFNKEIGFLCGLIFFALNIFGGEYLQSSLHLMLQIWWNPQLWKLCQWIMMRF